MYVKANRLVVVARIVLPTIALSVDTTVPEAQADSLDTAQVNKTGLAVSDGEVTVGQLHSATGTMAISETGSIQAERLAIDQINASGGILGRKIKIIQEDGASDWPTFAEKGQEAARQRQGRGGVRLLDVRLAQGGVAGVREGERAALLPDLLRRARAVEERLLHRSGGDPADHRRPRLAAKGEEGQDVLPDRLGLHLAAHLQQDRPQAHRERAQGHGGRRGVLSARPHAVRLADQQDQAARSRTPSTPSSSAAATSPSTSR